MPLWPLRKSSNQPLAVSMVGIKLGDRLLCVGCGDPMLLAQIASGGQIPMIPPGMLGGMGEEGAESGDPSTAQQPQAAGTQQPQEPPVDPSAPTTLCTNAIHQQQDNLLDALISRLTKEKMTKLVMSGAFDQEDLGIFGLLHKVVLDRQKAEDDLDAAAKAARTPKR